MSDKTTTETAGPAVGSPVDRGVGPAVAVAWYYPDGKPCTLSWVGADEERMAEFQATHKLGRTELVSRAQLDAAVAAERERLIARLRQIGMYECGCAQDAQHCAELADQLAMESTGADWPDRRPTEGPNAATNRTPQP